MPVTRFAEDPLLSEEETLRRATLMQLSRAPTPDSARAILRALLHFMQESAALSEPFVVALTTPPMARVAEDPILELLDHEEEAVREQAAFMLYRIRIRESSRRRLLQALADDRSPWVRAHAAKALAILGGNALGPILAEAIDNEATPEAVSRLAEALALLGQPQYAPILRDQADQLWERGAEADAVEATRTTLRACSIFVDALAASLASSEEPGALRGDPGGPRLFVREGRGAAEIFGGAAQLGYVARVKLEGALVLLPQDSAEAVGMLQ